MQRISTTYKLTILLALMSTAPMLLCLSNYTGSQLERELEFRQAISEQLATSCSLHLNDRDYRAISQLMDQFMTRTAGTGSLKFSRFDGLIVNQVGEHQKYWNQAQESGTMQFKIPVLRGGREWGALEITFVDSVAETQLQRLFYSFAFTLVVNGILFGILLRRSLGGASSGAVPRRVKNTLDTIAGGVLIIQPDGTIAMANEAFQESSGQSFDELRGKEINSFGFRTDQPLLPWELAAKEGKRSSGQTLFLGEGETERCFVVNATPVFGTKNELAGTLVSFEDITVLEQQKQSLVTTLAELEDSKEQIRLQNVQLQELASMDALTGTFNRRSLFQQLEAFWEKFVSEDQQINCIMLDVDHFKLLNDNYGHAVGDQVLRDVSRLIKETITSPAIVGRYGGEEFCVAIPEASLDEAAAVGELIRSTIETQLAEPYAVTASFGVSSSVLGAASYQAMLEQADQALYSAKHGGRNAVAVWSEELANAEEEEVHTPTAAIELDQPISYHAVTSLHAALAYRDADTALHSQRVAEMSVTLARGLMSVSEMYILEIAALLHDIGKIGVPDSILLKPGKLDEREWKIMEAHARMGVEIVDSSFNSEPLSDIVKYHHNRFDGTSGAGDLAGKDIPLGARIVCIVDAFDAMVSNRVYRKGRPAEEAFKELRRCAGTQFDPDLVERFVNIQTGWRPDSRHHSNDMEDKLALAVGHLTERTMSAFETKDKELLSESLGKLKTIAETNELLAIYNLTGEIDKWAKQSKLEDQEEVMPLLQDLLDMCLMVQRAHIRDVAGRPEATENCPQREYFPLARAWDKYLDEIEE